MELKCREGTLVISVVPKELCNFAVFADFERHRSVPWAILELIDSLGQTRDYKCALAGVFMHYIRSTYTAVHLTGGSADHMVQIRDKNVAVNVPWDSTVPLDCSDEWRGNTHTVL